MAAPKKIRVGINGYGRIGRCVHRVILGTDDIEVVAVNSRGDVEARAHLLKYDSLYGKLDHGVEIKNKNCFLVNGREVASLQKRPPSDERIWDEYGVDVVLESTGVFRTREGMAWHLDAGAKKVILSAPPKSEDVPVFVMGVNHTDYAGQEIISNASCTTNCLAPVAKVLHEAFGIKAAHMTTIHAVTGDQNILDNTHKDLRRSRSFMPSIIPCKTGASKAIGQVLPEIGDYFTGIALRVPTPVGSMVDLAVQLGQDVSVEDVHAALEAAKAGEMAGLIDLSYEELVSVDYVGNAHSAIIDTDSTKMLPGGFLKLLTWYDNEWGYSNRVVDMMRHVMKDA